jgi:uncharacterized protein (TIGR03084 family)
VVDDPLLADLAAEHADLDELLAGLDDDAWDAPTPAPGFAVRDQVFHLAFGEELAAMALTDGAAFGSRLQELLGDLDGLAASSHEQARASAPDRLLGCWRAQRARTLAALRSVPADARVPWVTGSMSAASFATARLMETWAHGQDVYDGLGRSRPPTGRLRHVADLGVRTRAFAYRNRGLEPPATGVRVELEAPGGGVWTWGEPGDPDRVAGSALDFCLVVTQRRARADTGLVATGPTAESWLAIAQAFAGPPTETRRGAR